MLVNFKRRTVVHQFSVKEQPVRHVSFSPTADVFVVAAGRTLQLWQLPHSTKKEFAPLTLIRAFPAHHADILHVEWSSCGRFFITASEDMTVKLFTAAPVANFEVPVLAGHRDAVVAAFLIEDAASATAADKQSAIVSVGRDGSCFFWRSDAASESEFPVAWTLVKRCFFEQGAARVASACFCARSRLLTVGFADGAFSLYEVAAGIGADEDAFFINKIHDLSISQQRIGAVACNPTGEWVAFGCSTAGQLVVWEWQSETFVLKQQGHAFDMTAVDYAADGATLATGGDDGKVKLWNAHSGFCFVTFADHAAGVTAVRITKNGSIVVSASKDGTVRAFDAIRYRNFRTFTAPNPVQFSCVAVDDSGELVAAGAVDCFDVFVWSIATGGLVEVLRGHTGPVASISFEPHGHLLASASWDRTVRLWDVFGGERLRNTWTLRADAQAVAFSPDGREIVASALNGELVFFSVDSFEQMRSIHGRWDVSGGRRAQDRFSAASSTLSKYFTSFDYSPDGAYLIAGGNSKYVCIYDVTAGVLLKKFAISRNTSLDGVCERLNSRRMTPYGFSQDAVDMRPATASASTLPGVQTGALSDRRSTLPAIRVSCVRFSPNARAWAACSTEGLAVYSLDAAQSGVFDPLDIDISITPASVSAALHRKEHRMALLMALRLNEFDVVRHVYEHIPHASVSLIASSLPENYVSPLLAFIAKLVAVSDAATASVVPARDLRWISELMKAFYGTPQLASGEVKGPLRICRRAVESLWKEVLCRARQNTWLLKFMCSDAATLESLPKEA